MLASVRPTTYNLCMADPQCTSTHLQTMFHEYSCICLKIIKQVRSANRWYNIAFRQFNDFWTFWKLFRKFTYPAFITVFIGRMESALTTIWLTTDKWPKMWLTAHLINRQHFIKLATDILHPFLCRPWSVYEPWEVLLTMQDWSASSPSYLQNKW